MKVLHITYSSKGGAGIAAKRLHHALTENGISSAYISTNLTIDFNNKHIKDNFFDYHKLNIVNRIIRKIKFLFFLSRKQKIDNKIKSFSNENNFEIISSPYSKFKIEKHPLFLEADIINLHWVSGIIDYTSFFKKCKKPIVWTLHDMNPFMGIFHYENDALNNSKEIEDFNLKIKKIQKENINYIKRGAIVSPSQWLLETANKSGFFSNLKMKKITNSINLDVFCIKNKEDIRNEFSINNNEFVILFVAEDIRNFRKGFDLLINAINLIDSKTITIVTIGKDDIKVNDNIRVISLGRIYDEHKIAEIYNLSDVFVLPSREDNLPNVILECFATGTPLLGFKIGGIQEHILKDKTGLLVNNINPVSLSESILEIIDKKSTFDNTKIREYAKTNFSFQKQYTEYYSLYNELLD
ncbi:glycosyltransferase [Polaribacter aquimarinus]|uniref:Glycosyl transferase family 1 domain-containing protein n=1 Tax=Polaribacter aquimarinus TaxID=2100726 RepID=A0A2U2J7J1_9FLAO|nr:glycosyltransferase [Polaribacter aquimarinus]PWG04272.1 hypothetical protein DIS07_12730 [Polaribacter aquimarinus]